MQTFGNKYLGYYHLYWSPFYKEGKPFRSLILYYIPHEHKYPEKGVSAWLCSICEFPKADTP
jgi:hypothetical protein